MTLIEAAEELREECPDIGWFQFNLGWVSLDGSFTIEELEQILRLAKLSQGEPS